MNTIKIELYPDEYLRVVRSRLELTQAELAKRLGIARQVVSYYENGVFQIPEDRMAAIKRIAGIE